ncbi:hypothetical protein LCGC14_2990920 [marine sediment metagenome]|uniref:Uncharacterized protein n=1 Tax=marine sediment metagenome TaxID=412755 RepID=A0A0F8X4I2_9ZZZZ
MPFLWDDEGLLDAFEYRLGPPLRPLLFAWRKLRCLARGHTPEPRYRTGISYPARIGIKELVCHACLRCGATTTKLRVV